MKDYSVWSQVLNHDGSINSEDIIMYFDTLEEARKYGVGAVIRYYSGCNGNWDWSVAENGYDEWKKGLFIINEKRQTGEKSYKSYSWDEVLEWFGVPGEERKYIESPSDLEEWCEKRDGLAFQYDIERVEITGSQCINMIRREGY